MKIDFSHVLTDIMTGKPIKDGETSLTLATVVVNALMVQSQDDKDLSGKEKVEAYQLATRIVKGGVVDITSTEAALMKERVSKLYGALVVGQVWPILDGEVPFQEASRVNEAAKEVANG